MTKPLTISRQGSFAAGGTVITNEGRYDPQSPGPAGQTLHGDHAYVSYQVPVGHRRLPIMMLHGHRQSSRTFETTADGREGFSTIFLRRGFAVYLIDQPRRGRAGQGTEAVRIQADPEDQLWFNNFRLGIWPDYFEGVQFAGDAATLNQFFRQSPPNTGPFDLLVSARATAAVFDTAGPGILLSHSQGGGVGWHARMLSSRIEAIVSYEPGSNFPFPEGETPDTLISSAGPLQPLTVPLDDFLKLTRIPIAIYYGDYIPAEWLDNPGQDQWRVRLDLARIWAETINRHGGDATVVHLPSVGITGNTHFPFSDLNNIEIADLVSDFLSARGLDD